MNIVHCIGDQNSLFRLWMTIARIATYLNEGMDNLLKCSPFNVYALRQLELSALSCKLNVQSNDIIQNHIGPTTLLVGLDSVMMKGYV